MTRVALITDTHFGVRGDSEKYHNEMEKFLSDIFFPYLIKNNIKKIIHLGDVFDNRRKIDIKTAEKVRKYFFEPALINDIQIDIIAGNHDLYKKETSAISTLNELINYENIKLFHCSEDVGNFLYIPWINKSNRDVTMQRIFESKSKIALGHLELSGFSFSKTQIAKSGDDPQNFKKFDRVYSGHYHYKHDKGNISYLGSPTEQTWTDCETDRGFHVIDDEDSGYLEFIPNESKLHVYVSYPPVEVGEFNQKEKFVRVRVMNVDKQSNLDKYIENIEKSGAYSVSLIDNSEKVKAIDINEDTDFDIDDTEVFLNACIEEEELKDIVLNLHHKALELV